MSATAAVDAGTRLSVRTLDAGRSEYAAMLARMRAHVAARGARDADELWLTEHPPVYTLGLAGREEHVRSPGTIPVLRSDRGGQVTWHGPGQAIVYLLVDLKRRDLKVREFVRAIEGAVIETLDAYGLAGARRAGMPGVYVAGAKIAALGLKVSRGLAYHGVSLNVDCDLEPFSRIDPCGYAGLATTSLAAQGIAVAMPVARARLAFHLAHFLEAHD
ncbi:MAG: lipoyl(octanoyl) transferase LipB [Burkholderiales bacterium]